MRSIRWLTTGASALVLVLSACSTGGGATSTTAPGATNVPAVPPTAATAPTRPPAATSAVASPGATTAPAGAPAASPASSPAAKPAASPVAAPGAKPTVRVGSTNFAEQTLLGEIYGQMLEANGYTVERKLNLGTREIVEPALESGQIDMYVEYLATMLAFVTKNGTPGSTDPAVTAKSLQDALTPRGITVLAYAPADDTNGFAVTKATADKYHLSKISDLAPVASQLVLGGPPECPTRPFCLQGLEQTYGLKFKDFKPLDAGGPVTVAALEGNQVDVGVLFTSDAVIAQRGFVLLQDDKHLQLSDNIAPVVRNDVLSKAPDMKALIDSVSAKITQSELTALNKQVGVDRVDPKDAASAWLKKMGLVK
jgi:osmoprotectant transport system substrate-binding protein